LKNYTTFLYLLSRYSRYMPALSSPCIESQTRTYRSIASRPSLDHLAHILLHIQLCPVVSFLSFPCRIHSYSAHSRNAVRYSGGWRIDIYTSRNRPTAERVLLWGGRERTATSSSRHAPPSSMKLSHPINLFVDNDLRI